MHCPAALLLLLRKNWGAAHSSAWACVCGCGAGVVGCWGVCFCARGAKGRGETSSAQTHTHPTLAFFGAFEPSTRHFVVGWHDSQIEREYTTRTREAGGCSSDRCQTFRLRLFISGAWLPPLCQRQILHRYSAVHRFLSAINAPPSAMLQPLACFWLAFQPRHTQAITSNTHRHIARIRHGSISTISIKS